jgi:DNA end-binding protein Ku
VAEVQRDQKQDQEQEEDRGRAFWSGTIAFGLVSIPVDLFPASRLQRVSLRMVGPDGTPLARRYFCSSDRKELDWDDIVRGYEIEKDEYVVVTDDELERLAPEKTRDIDLRLFVDINEIDPIHYERAYYLTPGGNSTKAYRLLAATMEATGRAGIATFVMRGKEYLIAILAENGILRAETLRFSDEIRSAEDIGLPDPKKPKPADVQRMQKAISALLEKALDEKEMEDRSTERLLELVARKEASGEDVVTPPEDIEVEPSESVVDLMAVLKRSLQGEGGAATTEKRARSGKRAKASGGARKKADVLAAKSKDELYREAKKLDIGGRSEMTKNELIEAIRRSA